MTGSERLLVLTWHAVDERDSVISVMRDEIRLGRLLDGKLDAWLRLRRSLRAGRSPLK